MHVLNLHAGSEQIRPHDATAAVTTLARTSDTAWGTLLIKAIMFVWNAHAGYQQIRPHETTAAITCLARTSDSAWFAATL